MYISYKIILVSTLAYRFFFAEFAPRHYRCKPILKSQKAVSAAKWLPSKYDYVQVNDVLDKDKKQANQSSSYSS